ncbi:hypothetical protein ElyMa_003089100 [Elysia marginata]|uniref:Uncharacterized protein n=1 Tax=Elysia marginata TaxID=1093978 RepID=A0AAV4ILY2_9GAST|nr:hypothetical protein ElyMa_003089100 [Elysia marginata]
MGGALSCLYQDTIGGGKRRPRHLDYSVTIRLSEDADTPDHINFYSNSALSGGTPPPPSPPPPPLFLDADLKNTKQGVDGEEQGGGTPCSGLQHHHHHHPSNHQLQEFNLQDPFPRDSVPLLDNAKEVLQLKPDLQLSKDGRSSSIADAVHGGRTFLPAKERAERNGQLLGTFEKEMMLNGHKKSGFKKREADIAQSSK